MKQKLLAVLAVALSSAVGLLIAEIVFRLALPPVPGDEGSATEFLMTAQRSPGAPRLFPAGYSAVFDIRGLYEGASKVEFKIGPNRFIPPEPTQNARYKVLFLGGSVTEGIFLPAEARWPGRLNDGGDIAAYNASMSAAGTLAQYATAKFLSERGDRYDLVVLATNHNDSTWTRRFVDIGSRYDFDHYAAGLTKIYEKEFFEEKKPNVISLRTLAWVRHLIRVARINALNAAAEKSAQAQGGASGDKPHALVVEGLIKLQDGTQLLPKAPLKDCEESSSPRTFSKLAYEDWKSNLPRFRSEMKRLLGAELLVVSEPEAYGAPADSFYASDLRVYPFCTTAAGKRAIESNDVIEFERERAGFYLDAARAAGALTFDLAAAMEPYSNGAHGGELFFDGIHPTPKGAEKFAELLRPALTQALAGLNKQ